MRQVLRPGAVVAGSQNAAAGILNLTNNGTGSGVTVDSAVTGVLVQSATGNGVQVKSANFIGVDVESAGGAGVFVNVAGNNGLQVGLRGEQRRAGGFGGDPRIAGDGSHRKRRTGGLGGTRRVRRLVSASGLRVGLAKRRAGEHGECQRRAGRTPRRSSTVCRSARRATACEWSRNRKRRIRGIGGPRRFIRMRHRCPHDVCPQ